MFIAVNVPPIRHRLLRALRVIAMLAGAYICVLGVSVAWAKIGTDCRGLQQAVSLNPPGLHCTGPKDDYVIPWDTKGPAVLPSWLVAAVVGAMVTFFGWRAVQSLASKWRIERDSPQQDR